MNPTRRLTAYADPMPKKEGVMLSQHISYRVLAKSSKQKKIAHHYVPLMTCRDIDHAATPVPSSLRRWAGVWHTEQHRAEARVGVKSELWQNSGHAASLEKVCNLQVAP